MARRVYPGAAPVVKQPLAPFSDVGDALLVEDDNGYRYWDLELVCTHHTERTARYKNPEDRADPDRRTAEDVLPAPLRVRCEECQHG